MMGAGYMGKKSMSRWLEDDDMCSFYRRAVWKEKFAFFPHRCELTNKILWFKKCILGTAMYTGPGDPVYAYHWRDIKEHTLWLLKN